MVDPASPVTSLKPIRVFILDDHELVRRGLVDLLQLPMISSSSGRPRPPLRPCVASAAARMSPCLMPGCPMAAVSMSAGRSARRRRTSGA